MESISYPVPGMNNVTVVALFDYQKKVVHLWRDEVENISSRTKGHYQWSLGELPFDNNFATNLSDVINKISQGLVRCCYCGKWIPLKESHWFVPAGCSCHDCYDKGKVDEADYFSYGD